jgi:hypothetical protein
LAVKGKFGSAIPPSFNAGDFLKAAQHEIPESSYSVLRKHHLQVLPKGNYYLLKVLDPKDNSLIFFSYSCDNGSEGCILEDPLKYDENNLELYDNCGKRH